ncbi:hypothetical protein LCGC14_1117560 [marine sediment metagenome]|uniref:Uncharacterized protein n=1 Tax=marine sediment metagenome TaxID=412755 RepID=A0A0F9M4V8_9ZZZZ
MVRLFGEIDLSMVRCRACIKCKSYLVIHPNNPINQVALKTFERNHSGHTIMTVDLNEVKGIYTPLSNNGKVNHSEESS